MANLEWINVEAESEREGLQRAVGEFKAVVSKFHAAGEAIPWLDPPLLSRPDEQERLIAVHL